MAPYEALYGHRCRTPSCWTKLGEQHALAPELVSDTEDKVKLIQDQLNMALDRQKSYADLKRKETEYFVGDFVFLKVSPWKKIEVKPDLTFEEEPVRILDREVKVLRRKLVPLVKVLWQNHSSEEATWELDERVIQIFEDMLRHCVSEFKGDWKEIYKVGLICDSEEKGESDS
ncbi:uncharacterized protein [Gossypium hirsutum]|uniref:DNA/RNA polymerases superfamily protein n=1 Tax=Gossypium hirsutum TaxID=3635 RepID=A0ABM2YNG6_GOSHI|nr:uncharacterized protein LOC121205993 [Gossypium hirsutum]